MSPGSPEWVKKLETTDLKITIRQVFEYLTDVGRSHICSACTRPASWVFYAETSGGSATIDSQIQVFTSPVADKEDVIAYCAMECEHCGNLLFTNLASIHKHLLKKAENPNG